MLEVHNDGRSVVSTGTREEMERDVQAMHEYGLWATMEKKLVSGFRTASAQRPGHRDVHRLRGRPAASLASQLVELLRNERAVPVDGG